MKKLLIIPLIATVAGCGGPENGYPDIEYIEMMSESEYGEFAGEPVYITTTDGAAYTMAPTAYVEMMPDSTVSLALDCVDWRVYANVYGNTVTMTAENIYTPREMAFPLKSFNARLAQTAAAPDAYAGMADGIQYGVSLEFPLNQSADGIYALIVTDTGGATASRSHRYVCRPIFPK